MPDSSATRGPVLVQTAGEADLAQIQAIYARHVLRGLGTFEETPPLVEEMAARHDAVTGMGLPFLVAEVEGQVAGYCYAAEFRARSAFRYTVEDSVYVREDLYGRGVGSALLGELIDRCEPGPWRQMVAVIGDSANLGSIALHRRWGFEHIGNLPSVGYKLGRWVDTVIMQRALGPGDSCPPE